jgi:hypothetical protein
VGAAKAAKGEKLVFFGNFNNCLTTIGATVFANAVRLMIFPAIFTLNQVIQ